MANISNPNNVKGMARLLAPEDDDTMEKTIEEIERSITNGGHIKGTDGETDYAASFMKDTRKTTSVNGTTNKTKPTINGFYESSKKEQKIIMPIDKGLIGGSDDESDDYDKIINKAAHSNEEIKTDTSYGRTSDMSYGRTSDMPYNRNDRSNQQNGHSDFMNGTNGNVHGGTDHTKTFNQFSMSAVSMPSTFGSIPSFDSMAPSAPPAPSVFDQFSSSNFSTSRPKFTDPNIVRLTEEQKKQNVFREVSRLMEPAPADNEVLNQEDEEEEMAHMVEQVDTLKANLTEAGIDISNIQEITVDTPKREAQKVLRVLQIKNDRLRYCDIFEESILAGAYALEKIFDGEREIFGKRIDMNGYSDTVRVKLKRMRYDTGTFVSGVMKGYNISAGWRIALEILPTLFTYTRDRSRRNKDNLGNSQDFRKALQDLYPEKNNK